MERRAPTYLQSDLKINVLRRKAEIGIEQEKSAIREKENESLVKMTNTLESRDSTVKFSRNLYVWRPPSTFAQKGTLRFNDNEYWSIPFYI
ncbi:hypothetical protein CDAR_538761 [Caerostris darwini]|uniref:Uncharacterized protein n=1 Tax=Caerostris darwini TaxID=1538125 RepID=A0AAV4T1B6_9ARAC|nr:hypothetical protein CDAR_538761 [Caerostris darwini]